MSRLCLRQLSPPHSAAWTSQRAKQCLSDPQKPPLAVVQMVSESGVPAAAAANGKPATSGSIQQSLQTGSGDDSLRDDAAGDGDSQATGEGTGSEAGDAEADGVAEASSEAAGEEDEEEDSDSESDAELSAEEALEALQGDPRTAAFTQWTRVFAAPLHLRTFAAEQLVSLVALTSWAHCQ